MGNIIESVKPSATSTSASTTVKPDSNPVDLAKAADNAVAALASNATSKEADGVTVTGGRDCRVTISGHGFDYRSGWKFSDFAGQNQLSLAVASEYWPKVHKAAINALAVVKSAQVLAVKFTAKYVPKDNSWRLARTLRELMNGRPDDSLITATIESAEKRHAKRLGDMKLAAGF
jgi:hypothetical protein